MRVLSSLALMVTLNALSAAVQAQGVRIQGSSTVRYIEVRPLLLVSDTATAGEPLALVPVTQDLYLNAWGLGRGVRAYAHLRARASLGERTDLWPQADDAFDALSAYLEIDRSIGRLRLGRQWSASRLGLYNFDGAALLARPTPFLFAELYGGWALAPGLNESVTGSALSAVEELTPGRRSNLIGGQIGLRNGPLRVRGEYQREIRTDRAGLYGERAAADASLDMSTWHADADIETDLTSRRINDARLNVQPPELRGIQPALQLRTYRPFFPLWTIWGAFSPAGFTEASLDLAWSRSPVMIDVRGAYRAYHDDDATGEVFGSLRSDGWRAGVNATWQASRKLDAFGYYQADIGFGAARSDGAGGLRLAIKNDSYVSARLLAFQTLHELQVREGTVLGVATAADVRIRSDARVTWDVALYRHIRARGINAVNWNQLRAALQLDWAIGSDPGMRALRREP